MQCCQQATTEKSVRKEFNRLKKERDINEISHSDIQV